MTLSAGAVRKLLSRESDDPIVLLLTIEYLDPALTPVIIRFCTNTPGDDLVSNGETFTAAPFEITWPNDHEEAPVAQLTCVNVDRTVGQALESLIYPADVTIQAVFASDPDTVEREATLFELRNARWNAMVLTADISRQGLTSEPCPKYRVTPRLFPALFR